MQRFYILNIQYVLPEQHHKQYIRCKASPILPLFSRLAQMEL